MQYLKSSTPGPGELMAERAPAPRVFFWALIAIWRRNYPIRVRGWSEVGSDCEVLVITKNLSLLLCSLSPFVPLFFASTLCLTPPGRRCSDAAARLCQNNKKKKVKAHRRRKKRLQNAFLFTSKFLRHIYSSWIGLNFIFSSRKYNFFFFVIQAAAVWNRTGLVKHPVRYQHVYNLSSVWCTSGLGTWTFAVRIVFEWHCWVSKMLKSIQFADDTTIIILRWGEI